VVRSSNGESSTRLPAGCAAVTYRVQQGKCQPRAGIGAGGIRMTPPTGQPQPCGMATCYGDTASTPNTLIGGMCVRSETPCGALVGNRPVRCPGRGGRLRGQREPGRGGGVLLPGHGGPGQAGGSEVDIVDLQTGQFRQAHSRIEEEPDDGGVGALDEATPRADVEQCAKLVRGEDWGVGSRGAGVLIPAVGSWPASSSATIQRKNCRSRENQPGAVDADRVSLTSTRKARMCRRVTAPGSTSGEVSLSQLAKAATACRYALTVSAA
jgi:hypothetical protein